MGRNRPIPQISDADKAFVRDLLIHEDEAILAFNKPSGLPVQTRGNRGRNLDHLLWTFARSNGKRPRLVHRIDTGTSGLIIAAKTKPAAGELSVAFASRRVEKTYLALVGGKIPEENEGVIEAPIASIEMAGRQRMIATETPIDGAKSASTAWEILSRKGAYALIRLRPKTGRMHQIRVHMVYLGCPILGDKTYGSGPLSAPRLMLHAGALFLDDPYTPLNLVASPHDDMLVACQAHGLLPAI